MIRPSVLTEINRSDSSTFATQADFSYFVSASSITLIGAERESPNPVIILQKIIAIRLSQISLCET